MGRNKGRRLKSFKFAKEKGMRTLADFPSWSMSLPIREGYERGVDVRSTCQVWRSSYGGYGVLLDGDEDYTLHNYEKLQGQLIYYVSLGEFGLYLGECERIGIGKCSLIKFTYCWAYFTHSEYKLAAEGF